MSVRRATLGAVLGTALILPAMAQAQAPPAPVYDSSGNWGLSNAGVPPGPYLRAGGGGAWSPNSKFDDSFVVGGGIGWRFLPWFRSDVTFDYRPDFRDKALGNAKFKNW